ncbi:MAG: hypothetical protein E5W81_08760 [Mesorhizobium sp.]|nr:MAG: hypothetical protein E5V36_05915 [Mesorhizobium sp.]TKB88137.1 MAG: hypothetical protein E5W81_08760 [Mesorhizobium sp.]
MFGEPPPEEVPLPVDPLEGLGRIEKEEGNEINDPVPLVETVLNCPCMWEAEVDCARTYTQV